MSSRCTLKRRGSRGADSPHLFESWDPESRIKTPHPEEAAERGRLEGWVPHASRCGHRFLRVRRESRAPSTPRERLEDWVSARSEEMHQKTSSGNINCTLLWHLRQPIFVEIGCAVSYQRGRQALRGRRTRSSCRDARFAYTYSAHRIQERQCRSDCQAFCSTNPDCCRSGNWQKHDIQTARAVLALAERGRQNPSGELRQEAGRRPTCRHSK